MRQWKTVVALALVAAACSEAEAPVNGAAAETRPATAAPKACDVLTAEVARAALGRDVERLDNDGGPAGLDICQYGYRGARLADAGNVSVTVQPVDLTTAIAAARTQGYELEPIAGLGDEADYSREFGLYVGKGNHTAIYLLSAGGLTDAKERSLALARATEGRL